MHTHTVSLQEDEYKLVQTLRSLDRDGEVQKRMIEELIHHIEEFLEQHSSKKPVKWLQIGNISCVQRLQPVEPEAGAPLASDVIREQRTRHIADGGTLTA